MFPLIACRKEPATRRGFHDATTNPATIRRWWMARPDYNIGIRTGAASGIWIFDIDTNDDKDGEASLRKLEAEHGKLPATMQSITANGRHAMVCLHLSNPEHVRPHRAGPRCARRWRIYRRAAEHSSKWPTLYLVN